MAKNIPPCANCNHCGKAIYEAAEMVTTEDNETICEGCAAKAHTAAQIVTVESIDGDPEFEDADTVIDPNDVKPDQSIRK